MTAPLTRQRAIDEVYAGTRLPGLWCVDGSALVLIERREDGSVTARSLELARDDAAELAALKARLAEEERARLAAIEERDRLREAMDAAIRGVECPSEPLPQSWGLYVERLRGRIAAALDSMRAVKDGARRERARAESAEARLATAEARLAAAEVKAPAEGS